MPALQNEALNVYEVQELEGSIQVRATGSTDIGIRFENRDARVSARNLNPVTPRITG